MLLSVLQEKTLLAVDPILKLPNEQELCFPLSLIKKKKLTVTKDGAKNGLIHPRTHFLLD